MLAMHRQLLRTANAKTSATSATVGRSILFNVLYSEVLSFELLVFICETELLNKLLCHQVHCTVLGYRAVL